MSPNSAAGQYSPPFSQYAEMSQAKLRPDGVAPVHAYAGQPAQLQYVLHPPDGGLRVLTPAHHRRIANPLPLGFMGFALTTALLQASGQALGSLSLPF
jgi:hypothetical protein